MVSCIEDGEDGDMDNTTGQSEESRMSVMASQDFGLQ